VVLRQRTYTYDMAYIHTQRGSHVVGPRKNAANMKR